MTACHQQPCYVFKERDVTNAGKQKAQCDGVEKHTKQNPYQKLTFFLYFVTYFVDFVSLGIVELCV